MYMPMVSSSSTCIMSSEGPESTDIDSELVLCPARKNGGKMTMGSEVMNNVGRCLDNTIVLYV